jgi:sigma-B regulation protein RsbU (phosphoserine phosphatase)
VNATEPFIDADELFEDAPCGYLATRPDGTIVRVNRTFERWTGLSREELVEHRRFQDLLTVGGRIYHETHYAPLLQMQGAVREIAVEIVRADGSRLPALINAVLHPGDGDRPALVRTTVFDATDRRRYEQELLRGRQREQEIASRLARSLLSGELPAGTGFELAVSYRPAVDGLEVGGDWYDAFWVADDELGLVVGDVVGRGIEAAATMGQLRSAARALASTGMGPAELLDGLEHYVRRHSVGRAATVVCATLSLKSGTLRYACAGHPPPLVAAPGAPAIFAWDGRSLPLDAISTSPSPRPEGVFALEPGSVIALYTDGLVERRTSPITHGMEKLRVDVEVRHDVPVAELAPALVEAHRDREHADDVCLLMVRFGA